MMKLHPHFTGSLKLKKAGTILNTSTDVTGYASRIIEWNNELVEVALDWHSISDQGRMWYQQDRNRVANLDSIKSKTH